MTQVVLLHADQGRYSDHNHWICGVFSTEAKAKEAVTSVHGDVEWSNDDGIRGKGVTITPDYDNDEYGDPLHLYLEPVEIDAFDGEEISLV